MIEAPLPEDETERLESLHQLQILDTPIDERFERITRIARHSLGVPIVAFSLIDKERQWFKSEHGLGATETDRKTSFCSHAILGDDIMLVPDATQDVRFSDNPVVTGDLNVRFYAGCPVRAPDGRKVGTLCAVDTRPRNINHMEIQSLRDLAHLLETEIRAMALSKVKNELLAELDTAQLLALVDPLTRLWNRRGIYELLSKRWSEAARSNSMVVVAMADIDHFKKINDTYGHPAGDSVLQTVSRKLLTVLRDEDAVGRVGGEEFLLILTGCQPAELKRTVERIRLAVCETSVPVGDTMIDVTMSFGAAAVMPDNSLSFDMLVSFADKALYNAKQAGRNRVEVLAPN